MRFLLRLLAGFGWPAPSPTIPDSAPPRPPGELSIFERLWVCGPHPRPDPPRGQRGWVRELPDGRFEMDVVELGKRLGLLAEDGTSIHPPRPPEGS